MKNIYRYTYLHIHSLTNVMAPRADNRATSKSHRPANKIPQKPHFELFVQIVQETPIIIQTVTAGLGCLPVMTELKVLKFPTVWSIEIVFLIAVGLSSHGSLKQSFQWGDGSVDKACIHRYENQVQTLPPVRNTGRCGRYL